MNEEKGSMEKGLQPLAGIMKNLNLKNHDLVAFSQEGLTHKMVSKGCKGRRLTLNVQHKILNALNAMPSAPSYKLNDLFNYAGKC